MSLLKHRDVIKFIKGNATHIHTQSVQFKKRNNKLKILKLNCNTNFQILLLLKHSILMNNVKKNYNWLIRVVLHDPYV